MQTVIDHTAARTTATNLTHFKQNSAHCSALIETAQHYERENVVHMKFKCRRQAAGGAVIEHVAATAIGYVSCYVFVFQTRPDKPLAAKTEGG